MDTAQHGEGDHVSRVRPLALHPCCSRRDGLADALVRAGVVDVCDIGAQLAPQVRLAEDEDVTETFPPQAAGEALAARSGVGCK
jgi:hypothetical protein